LELGCAASASTVMTKYLSGNLEKLFELVKRLGFRSLFINSCRPVFKNGKLEHVDSLTMPELANAFCQADIYARRYELDYLFMPGIPLCLFPPSFIERPTADHRLTTGCHIQKGSSFTFDTDGNVLPCNNFSEKPLGKLGEDFTDWQSFCEWWETLGSFRKAVSKYPSDECSICRNWDICGGGCIFYSLIQDDRQHTKRNPRVEKEAV